MKKIILILFLTLLIGCDSESHIVNNKNTEKSKEEEIDGYGRSWYENEVKINGMYVQRNSNVTKKTKYYIEVEQPDKTTEMIEVEKYVFDYYSNLITEPTNVSMYCAIDGSGHVTNIDVK